MARHPRWARTLLSDDDLAAVVEAVHAAEKGTSGEIRVHLERRVRRPRGAALDALARAREVFAQLGMHKTARRNGVLIYLAVEDRKVAIVGDEGIHARVGDAGWERLRDVMVERLRRGEARAAVVEAVREVGSVLARHFRRENGDIDELSDEVSIE
jgi:uncharacterized membrane protein